MSRKTTDMTRRGLLLSGGAGAVSLLLRGLATGLPPAFLANPHRAFAQGMGLAPQTLIFATSQAGDPINCNAPGAYVEGAEHPAEALLPSGNVRLGDARVTGAQAWQTLPNALRQRLAVFHLQTRSVAHPEQPSTLACHGSVKNAAGNGAEMLPSMIAELAAPGLNPLQAEPVPLAGEVITFGGQPLQSVKPSELQALFAERDAQIADLRGSRDAALDALYRDLQANGTRAQRSFLDRYANSRVQARALGEQLAALLAQLPLDPDDVDGAQDQVVAALALARLRVAPVITLRLPFGGDNHNDSDLSVEAAETTAGVARIGQLWQGLVDAQLQDEVSFALLNVFGRNLVRNAAGGRNHNNEHGVMLAFGAGFRGGVYGGVSLARGGLPIDPATGEGRLDAAIPAAETLEAAAKTVTRGLGHDPEVIENRIRGGRIIDAALA
ncbi:MAG: hypothetical protein KC613_03890 [Myxococcales bacterium]|nr:hypothetical protein [Myxococcales bacterium]MCB9524571.1 hypothetical protein [Myxococcales bacterium]